MVKDIRSLSSQSELALNAIYFSVNIKGGKTSLVSWYIGRWFQEVRKKKLSFWWDLQGDCESSDVRYMFEPFLNHSIV